MSATYQIGGFAVTDTVLNAVREASQRTGVDFEYLMAKAAQESGFQPAAHAPSSTAEGLYQFIESTWLAMVKRHGAEYGLGWYADQIDTSGGGARVADRALRQEILDLRRDPRLNALLAGAFANDNRAYLAQRVGGTIGPTELYLAHFLGAAGAGKFLEAMRANPAQSAANVFPDAARANRAIFYDRQSGAPKSLADVYDWLGGRIERGIRLAREAPGGGGGGPAMSYAMAAAPAAGADAMANFQWAIPRARGAAAGHPLAAAGDGAGVWSGFRGPASGGGLSLFSVLALSGGGEGAEQA